MPEASNIILLGPGVMDVTKENNDKAKSVSMFMLLSSLKEVINAG